mmetsp:Transcript_18251/g.34139  ORF Transcript_18251/g.34139 Transcript_18251/m.34139 type:complete len:217 (+) Transcript_18251:70-720(+)
MQRQRIPNDNSCLFTGIGFCLNGEFVGNESVKQRKLCVDTIKSDPDKFSELYLGKDVDEYCAWLMIDTSWGGEIEILILAEIWSIQVSVVQIETLTILTYSPPEHIPSRGRIYLLYTGQHYDVLIDADSVRSNYLFPTDDSYDSAALECAGVHKQEWEDALRTRKRKRIKCVGCGVVVVDTDAFQRHCEEVDHDDDFCYDCEEIEVVEMVATPDDD